MATWYCDVAQGHPVHGPFHDNEHGYPLRADDLLFERLALEIMQAGLSWLTVLKKREAFQSAFANFDPAIVANFTDADVERLMADPGIIRNRLKILALINNAQVILEMRRTHGGFANWLDSHHPQPKADWLKIFKKTVRFTGGEIVNEFLMGTGYLPGAHSPNCPIGAKIEVLRQSHSG